MPHQGSWEGFVISTGAQRSGETPVIAVVEAMDAYLIEQKYRGLSTAQDEATVLFRSR